MKKLIILLMAAFTAMVFVGCGAEDNTVADIAWKNDSATAPMYDIKWTGSTSVQTWNSGESNALPLGATNDPKGVEDLVGEGTCLGTDGGDYSILITGNNGTLQSSYTLTENSTETLIIDQVAKK